MVHVRLNEKFAGQFGNLCHLYVLYNDTWLIRCTLGYGTFLKSHWVRQDLLFDVKFRFGSLVGHRHMSGRFNYIRSQRFMVSRSKVTQLSNWSLIIKSQLWSVGLSLTT